MESKEISDEIWGRVAQYWDWANPLKLKIVLHFTKDILNVSPSFRFPIYFRWELLFLILWFFWSYIKILWTKFSCTASTSSWSRVPFFTKNETFWKNVINLRICWEDRILTYFALNQINFLGNVNFENLKFMFVRIEIYVGYGQNIVSTIEKNAF